MDHTRFVVTVCAVVLVIFMVSASACNIANNRYYLEMAEKGMCPTPVAGTSSLVYRPCVER